MSDYAAVVREHLRITLLRLLADAGGGYQAGESVLRDAVQRFGFPASRDTIRTELSWLGQQGLVSLEDIGGFLVAKLSARGLDVARGHETVPGVRRPGPD